MSSKSLQMPIWTAIQDQHKAETAYIISIAERNGTLIGYIKI